MQVLEHWDPLSLPRGSVRALVTLALLGVLWTLMLSGREVPLSLAFVVLLVLGHYFGSRGGREKVPGERQPLYLPRGSIRTVIILGFAAAGWFLWDQGRLVLSIEDRNMAIFFILGALLLGFVVRKIADMLSGGKMTRPRRLFENVKAILVIAATVLFAIFCLLEKKEEGLENLALAAVPVIVFYFGSRT